MAMISNTHYERASAAAIIGLDGLNQDIRKLKFSAANNFRHSEIGSSVDIGRSQYNKILQCGLRL